VEKENVIVRITSINFNVCEKNPRMTMMMMICGMYCHSWNTHLLKNTDVTLNFITNVINT
jgi:hypothetical protein